MQERRIINLSGMHLLSLRDYEEIPPHYGVGNFSYHELVCEVLDVRTHYATAVASDKKSKDISWAALEYNLRIDDISSYSHKKIGSVPLVGFGDGDIVICPTEGLAKMFKEQFGSVTVLFPVVVGVLEGLEGMDFHKTVRCWLREV